MKEQTIQFFEKQVGKLEKMLEYNKVQVKDIPNVEKKIAFYKYAIKELEK